VSVKTLTWTTESKQIASMLQQSMPYRYKRIKLDVFPVASSTGNKYIMVLYEYDSNAILSEPINNLTAAELLRAFQVMEKKITERGLQPKLMRLDNEASP
jgi:hypothetical protein